MPNPEDSVDIQDTYEEEHELDYVRVEEFSLLGREKFPIYQGAGAKKFGETYDPAKAAFLEAIGIELPEWIVEDRGAEELNIIDREALVTMFIVTNHILSVHDSILDGESLEEVELYLEGLNRNFQDTRVDHSQLRKGTASGKRMEEYVRDRGGSANVPCKVSEDDLYRIIGHVFDQLRRASTALEQTSLLPNSE